MLEIVTLWINYRWNLQVTMANRVVLQVDQSESQDQIFSLNLFKCGDKADLGGDVLLLSAVLYQISD